MMQPAQRAAGIAMQAQVGTCKGTVLIVDDEAELRFILKAHLRAAEFEVLEACSGADALEMARERLPDLIILDLGLPDMDGITVTRALKSSARTEPIPIIILTARTGSGDIIRGLDAGAQEYLPKPFDVGELLARVRTIHRLVEAQNEAADVNYRLEAEVSAKTHRLRTLYEFMRDLNHAETRQTILDLLVNCVENTTGAKRISVFLVEEGGDSLKCERAVGIDPAAAERMQLRATEGIAGQVFRNGRTVAARTYPGTPEDKGPYTRDAFICTPLISTSLSTSDGIMGVLNVTEKSDNTEFSEDEVNCIRSIADAGAIALTNLRRRERLQHSVNVLLRTLGHLAEYRDEETTVHLERVSRLSRVLGEELRRGGSYAEQISETFIHRLVQAAPLHDIGKVGIPDDILTKPGRLTDEEYEIMKTHTEIGRRVLLQAVDPTQSVPLLGMCIEIVYCHHERFDGTGYPQGLSGTDIPLAARIIALVDAYDAMTSERRYKRAKSHEQAVEIIRGESGKHFDPVVVDAFLRCQRAFDRVRREHVERDAPILTAS